MARFLVATVLALSAWAASLPGHAASTFGGLPSATVPLGSVPDHVPLDQGAGCATNTLPCTTVEAPSVRVGQPVVLNCSTIASPFTYQSCIDTSTALPTLKSWFGGVWSVIGTYDTGTGVWTPPVGGGTATLPSAGTTDLGSIPQAAVTVSGTTGITSFGSSAKTGTFKFVRFSGALVLTHNATSMILPGAANITTAAGDAAIAQALGSSNWAVVGYQRAASPPVIYTGVTGTGLLVLNNAPALISPTITGTITLPDGALSASTSPLVPSVPTNAALTAAATTAFPNGVWRLHVTVGDSAPPAYFVPSAVACTIVGGDIGSQVPSSDAKCWLARYSGNIADVRQWGVPTDGTTNARPTLQAAFTAAGAMVSPLTVRLPALTYALTDGVSLSMVKSAQIEGSGWLTDSSNPAGDPTQGTVLKWSNATAAPILTIKSATASNYLSNGSIRGIHFSCNNVATYGIFANSVNFWEIDATAGYCVTAGLQLDDGNGVYSEANIVNKFNYIWGTVSGTTGASHGVVIKAASAPVGAPQNQIRLVEGLVYNGDMVRFENVDNNVVTQVNATVSAGGTGKTLGFRGTAQNNTIVYANGSFAADLGTFGNRILNLNSETGYSTGGVFLTVGLTTNATTTIAGIPSTVGITVGGIVSGDGIPTTAVVEEILSATTVRISLVATSTSPGAITIVFRGANFDYKVRDYTAGKVYASSPDYVLIDLQVVRAETMSATTGAAATAVNIGALWGNAFRFDNAALNGVGFNYPVPSNWNGGRIMSIRLRYYYTGVVAACNELIRVRAGAFGSGEPFPVAGASILTPEIDQTSTMQSIGNASTMQDMNIPLNGASGLVINSKETAFFRIDRDAVSVGNTCAANSFYLVQAGLVYLGNGPISGGDGPWSRPAWPQ